jgi:hypothetical protein
MVLQSVRIALMNVSGFSAEVRVFDGPMPINCFHFNTLRQVLSRMKGVKRKSTARAAIPMCRISLFSPGNP